MEERRWKIGELARATGLTVRTLHHFDELGLLRPAERTSAGHRFYGEPDVGRLYRIVALRRLGFGLDEVGSFSTNVGPTCRTWCGARSAAWSASSRLRADCAAASSTSRRARPRRRAVG